MTEASTVVEQDEEGGPLVWVGREAVRGDSMHNVSSHGMDAAKQIFVVGVSGRVGGELREDASCSMWIARLVAEFSSRSRRKRLALARSRVWKRRFSRGRSVRGREVESFMSSRLTALAMP
jgi:hypothetical protein